MSESTLTIPCEPAKLGYAIAKLSNADFDRLAHSLCWALRDDPARLQRLSTESHDRLYALIGKRLQERR